MDKKLRYKLFNKQTGEPVAYVDDILAAFHLIAYGDLGNVAIMDTRSDLML